MSPQLTQIKNILLVLSGKGGVGKSTVSTELALTLASQNHKVGVLDVDLCGPSIPRLLGVEDKSIVQDERGWLPIKVDKNKQLHCISIGFLSGDKNKSIVWRGPKKNAMIKQFLTEVYWGELDYLIIDTPPGTSDEHLSLVEYLKEHASVSAILVTTPQKVALLDVRKELDFCRKTGLHILGIIENMSGFICPHCSDCSNLFSRGGGKALANEYGIPFLGTIPIYPQVSQLFDTHAQPNDGFNENVSNSEDEVGNLVAKFNSSVVFPYLEKIVEAMALN